MIPEPLIGIEPVTVIPFCFWSLIYNLLNSGLGANPHDCPDRTGGWTDATKGHAPNKPLLLLSLLDLFAQGIIKTNFIEVTPELGDLFATYWSRVIQEERQGNIALPFFHLRSSCFWHLIPQLGQEEKLRGLNSVGSLSQLRKVVIGANLDNELFDFLHVESARDTLRAVLMETYFSPESRNALATQTSLNIQSFVYSQELIEMAHRQIKETLTITNVTQQVVRDQGFRKAIVHIYEHRCAFCGVRLLTVDGHSVVDAAHIIPWSINRNDDLHNGMALCRLCHWTFDEGLISVSQKYLVIVSPEIRISSNIPGHLVTLESRPILAPTEQDLYPALDALAWHRTNVFRKV